MEVIMFGCATQSNAISSASHSIFLHAFQMEICYNYINSGEYFFFECFVVAFALYPFYEYMFLRRIIETKFLPGVRVHYEKQSDNESSDERKTNVQQIFVCIINHSVGKNILYVFSIYTSFVV